MHSLANSRPLRATMPALPQLPRRQAAWIAAAVALATALYASGLWSSQPELCLMATLAIGPFAGSPRRAWALPLVGAGVLATGLTLRALDWAPVLGAAAVAGAAAAWALPQRTDWLDMVHGALGTAAGAAFGLVAAVGVVPDPTGSAVGASLTALLVALGSSQGLLPVALRLDRPPLPSRRTIRHTLRPVYRPPVHRAFDLHARCKAQAPDPTSGAGLAEVALWVYRLQLTLQTLDYELGAIDPVGIAERIRACEGPEDDAFTAERKLATAQHLHRLLDHRELIERERRRTDALVDYALAFLDEARAGLAVAKELPGEAMPDRLPDVLHRLRSHAEAGDARRQTTREMSALQA